MDALHDYRREHCVAVGEMVMAVMKLAHGQSLGHARAEVLERRRTESGVGPSSLSTEDDIRRYLRVVCRADVMRATTVAAADKSKGVDMSVDRGQLRRGARSVNAAISDSWGHVSE